MNCPKCNEKMEFNMGVILIRDTDIYSADAAVCKCGYFRVSGVSSKPYMKTSDAGFVQVKSRFVEDGMLFEEQNPIITRKSA